MTLAQSPDFDAIIIGAGMSGLFQLHRLRELGLRIRVFEAGSGVGGSRSVSVMVGPSSLWRAGGCIPGSPRRLPLGR